MDAAARRASLPRYLPRGWQPYALFLALPGWWLLGFSHFIWPILGIAMLLSLLLRPQIRVPPRFGIWLLFLAWMLASVVQVDSAGRLLGFGLRFSLYLSATLLFLYLFNASPKQIPSRAIVYALAGYWVLVVVGGFLGVFFPTVSFQTPTARLLPDWLVSNEYVHDMVQARFAEVEEFLGYPLGRPQAFFTYTNGWGSALALLTPFAFAALESVRSKPWRRLLQIVLVLSIIPAVMSVNRGLWISLGAGLMYVAIRFALGADFKALRRIVVSAAIAAAVIVATPLGGLIAERLEHQHSNEARKALYAETFERSLASPLVGYGAPRPAESDSYLESAGTQGQVLYLMFSHGFPALVLFLAWFLYVVRRTARATSRYCLWAHVTILIALLQTPFYGLTMQLFVIMAAAAVALREVSPAAVSEAIAHPASARGRPAAPSIPALESGRS